MRRKIVKYKTVRCFPFCEGGANNSDELDMWVNECLEEGWELYGFPYVATYRPTSKDKVEGDEEPDDCSFQAMVKYENKELPVYVLDNAHEIVSNLDKYHLFDQKFIKNVCDNLMVFKKEINKLRGIPC